MSYHNNYNGGGYNRGGFRNNNYGFNRNSGGFHNNEPRINETDVPQSKHTIFIRGLHGDTTTDEIQDYIGEKIGRVSFDFVKMAQDGSKIFVAVRFEKRDEAKEFMATYSNREFMGVRCELSWFRDIRRFCAYQRARQLRSNSQRRRRRSDSEESNGGKRRSESPPIRRRSRSEQSKSPARSGSRSSTRTRSESPDETKTSENDRISRTRNRSDSRRKSRSSTRSSGRSQSSHRSQSSQRSASSRRSEGECSRVSSRAHSRAESTAESRRSRRNSETAQKRRRESSAGSTREELKEKKIPKKESPLRIPLPTKTTPIKNSPSPASQKSGYIPPPSMDMDIETSPQHTNSNVSTNPYPQHQQFQNYKPDSTTSKVSYSMPMDGDSPPKMIIREPQAPAQTAQYYPTVKVAERSESLLPSQPPASSSSSLLAPAAPVAPAPVVTMPTTPSFVPRQIGRIEIVMPASLPLPPPAPPAVVAQVTPPPPPPPSSSMDGSAFGAEQQQKQQMTDGSNAQMQQQQQLPSTNKLFGHLKAFQSALLSTVKYEIPSKDADGEITGLRLSSMKSSDDDMEEVKAMEREQKLCKLNDDQMMRFLIQKKKFETAFRNDCETYAVVTRALLSKDETMQFTLKMALHENMEDLHKQFMKRVDDYLDQLLAC
ncbi:hypothetical protein CAEBREN_13401 [Caenorhabditis brenneri]|uniref:RRM domain-containing protein n=1 Tax=Caenorhabditis brenneri TaxID=135651 RepID=G0P4V0_CAEBE|nr:hypothetical protein CAEBREN_13401 [Caenorhabditis brenneri]